MMSKRDIVREFFAYPQIPEQKEIVTLLDGVETQVIALENKCNALQQVKKSLLQNLLTGKIRILPFFDIHEETNTNTYNTHNRMQLDEIAAETEN